MIKEYNTFGDLDNTDYEDTDKIYKAIENILAERKQNKAKIKELEEKNRVLCEEYCPRIAKIKDLIKILEDWLKVLDDFFEKTRINNTKERNALRNALAERKQDKARIKELEEEKKAMCEEYCPKTERIKDLIENETINISGFECIAVEDLEELLEESK